MGKYFGTDGFRGEAGTEPVVRVIAEAPDHDTCQKYVNEVVNVICEKGYKA